MKRIFLCCLAAVAILTAVVPAPPVAAADGAENDTYVVRPGDTLSGIAGQVLGDMKRWPELLEANPQITDPEMIYPGDTIALPTKDREEAVAVSGGDAIDEEQKAQYQAPPPRVPPPPSVEGAMAPPSMADLEQRLPVETVRPIPVIGQNLYKSAGYISKTLPETTIVSSVERKISLVEGDEVFIGTRADEGETFTILRPVQKVYHPRTGDYLGWVLKVMGWAEVTCPGDNSARAVLVSTLDTVEVGDLVAPFNPEDILEDNRLGPTQSTFCLKKEEENLILAIQEKKRLIVSGDIVFLDRGRSGGVKAGDLFVVYRQVEPEGIVVIGQLQVLRTGDQTSTALVINSLQEMEINDYVQSWDPSAGG